MSLRTTIPLLPPSMMFHPHHPASLRVSAAWCLVSQRLHPCFALEKRREGKAEVYDGTARERSSATTSVQKLVQVQDEVVAEGAPYESVGSAANAKGSSDSPQRG
ncbi:hypothetical protein B0H13DRAFT_1914496 [Mycena leptocephala]|nr:hypothetical protein B0H13DRAFT_1914496 [Mycena leptocephala]